MAQSSAQREPSMEEILASIRRIIEDSDSGRKPDDGIDAADHSSDGFPGVDVEAFRSELRSGANDPLPPRSGPPEPWPARPAEAATAANGPRAFSMPDLRTDIASRPQEALVASSPIAATPAPVPAVEYDSAQASPIPTSPSAPSLQASPPQFRAGQSGNNEDAELDQAISAALEKVTLVPHEPEQSNWNVVEEVNDGEVAKSEVPASSRGPIISQQTGRQVAAAFGELSEAFAASRRKSFDELAEEMMRPMLQDWLDNNLPMLVEKLVREEIERIARGAQ